MVEGLGFSVEVCGFGVWGLGFGVQGIGSQRGLQRNFVNIPSVIKL